MSIMYAGVVVAEPVYRVLCTDVTGYYFVTGKWTFLRYVLSDGTPVTNRRSPIVQQGHCKWFVCYLDGAPVQTPMSAAGKLPVSVLPHLQVRVLLISCSVPSCRLLRLMSLSSIEYAHGLLANAAIKTVTWLRRRSTGSMRRSLQ